MNGLLKRATATLAAVWAHKFGLAVGAAVGAGAAILIGGDIAFGWLVFWVVLGGLLGAGVQWLAKNWREFIA